MNVELARIQFAFTSVNHFFFVPVTIGLAFLTALLQTAWYRTRQDEYLRLTRFFGTLLVINVAIGVVTGLVQEFQFGMDWGAMTVVVIIFLPLVLGYQAWTYYVFRQRVSRSEFQPAPQPSTPPGAGHPTAAPEATSPPSRHGP